MPSQPELRVVRPARRKADGFTVSTAFIEHLPRLSSGHSCTLLLLTLWARSAGRGQRHDWTPGFLVGDMAELCRCSTRTVQRLVVWLDQRGLAEVRRLGKGRVEVRLKYREWAALPDHGNPLHAERA